MKWYVCGKWRRKKKLTSEQLKSTLIKVKLSLDSLVCREGMKGGWKEIKDERELGRFDSDRPSKLPLCLASNPHVSRLLVWHRIFLLSKRIQ